MSLGLLVAVGLLLLLKAVQWLYHRRIERERRQKITETLK
jgi:hypothetical protein